MYNVDETPITAYTSSSQDMSFIDPLYCSSYNEKGYKTLVGFGGVLWGVGILLMLKYTYQAFAPWAFLLTSIALFLWIVNKKSKLDKVKKPTFTLQYPYRVIIGDFANSFVSFGLGACILDIFIGLYADGEFELQFNYKSGLLLIHILLAIYVFQNRHDYADLERAGITGIVKKKMRRKG